MPDDVRDHVEERVLAGRAVFFGPVAAHRDRSGERTKIGRGRVSGQQQPAGASDRRQAADGVGPLGPPGVEATVGQQLLEVVAAAVAVGRGREHQFGLPIHAVAGHAPAADGGMHLADERIDGAGGARRRSAPGRSTRPPTAENPKLVGRALEPDRPGQRNRTGRGWPGSPSCCPGGRPASSRPSTVATSSPLAAAAPAVMPGIAGPEVAAATGRREPWCRPVGRAAATLAGLPPSPASPPVAPGIATGRRPGVGRAGCRRWPAAGRGTAACRPGPPGSLAVGPATASEPSPAAPAAGFAPPVGAAAAAESILGAAVTASATGRRRCHRKTSTGRDTVRPCPVPARSRRAPPSPAAGSAASGRPESPPPAAAEAGAEHRIAMPLASPARKPAAGGRRCRLLLGPVPPRLVAEHGRPTGGHDATAGGRRPILHRRLWSRCGGRTWASHSSRRRASSIARRSTSARAGSAGGKGERPILVDELVAEVAAPRLRATRGRRNRPSRPRDARAAADRAGPRDPPTRPACSARYSRAARRPLASGLPGPGGPSKSAGPSRIPSGCRNTPSMQHSM